MFWQILEPNNKLEVVFFTSSAMQHVSIPGQNIFYSILFFRLHVIFQYLETISVTTLKIKMPLKQVTGFLIKNWTF